jgi:hypothetical protein
VLVVLVIILVATVSTRVLVAAGAGGHQAVLALMVLSPAQQVVKQLTLMAKQLLGQAATQQEFTGAYHDIFSF